MRIIQDMGLLSASGTAAAPIGPSQCGTQVEAALQVARLELAQRAAARGANAVFQTSYVLDVTIFWVLNSFPFLPRFSTAFHQWGVTVLACGNACAATMITSS